MFSLFLLTRPSSGHLFSRWYCFLSLHNRSTACRVSTYCSCLSCQTYKSTYTVYTLSKAMKKCEFSPLHRPRYIFFHSKFHWAFLFKNLWEANYIFVYYYFIIQQSQRGFWQTQDLPYGLLKEMHLDHNNNKLAIIRPIYQDYVFGHTFSP